MLKRLTAVAAGALLISLVAGAVLAPAALAATAPRNDTPPTMAGQPNKGNTITAASGSWSGTTPISFTYQWQRCNSAGASCSSISGATGATYTLTNADVNHSIRVQVTASNSAGSAQAVSGQSAVVTNQVAPASTAAPAISGTLAQGSTLTVTNGTWTGTPAPTFTYQWQRCDSNGANCADISGATNKTYTLQAADVGNRVLATVKATNGAGSASKASAVTAAIGSVPANTSPPLLSGNALVGQALKVDQGTWTGTPAPTITWQWARCDENGNNCSDISGATSQSYTLAAADVGHKLKVRVTGTNAAGSKAVDTAFSAVVVQPIPPTVQVKPQLAGLVRVGRTIRTTNGTWTGTQPIALAYRWQRCNTDGAVCLDIPGATKQSYALTGDDLGLRVQAIVTATGPGGQTSQATGPSPLVTRTPTVATIAQRVVFLRSGGRIRLDLLQVRGSQSVRLTLALDVWRNGAWQRTRTANVAYGEPTAAQLLRFSIRSEGRHAAVLIRYRLSNSHVGAFTYTADLQSLRRTSALRIVATA
jgi:hypothetical protein